MSFWKPEKVTYTHRPIANIEFRQDTTKITLALQDDVTAKEAADIGVMYAVAVGTAMTMALWDYIGYIKEHKLERHFKFEELQ